MKTNIVIDVSPPTHIWQNTSFELWAKMLKTNAITRFFKM